LLEIVDYDMWTKPSTVYVIRRTVFLLLLLLSLLL